MFAIKKLILAAACVALALGPSAVAAESQGMHLRIRISNDDAHSVSVKEISAADFADLEPVSSTDSSGDSDDAEGSAEDDGKDDNDSDDEGEDSDEKDADGSGDSADEHDGGEQSGSERGGNDSHWESATTGGSGTDDAPPAFCSGDGEYTMSVEFIPGIFCVSGPACAAENSQGVCPGPQDGLPLGAYCGKVSSGAFGCKAFTKDTIPPPPPADDEGSSQDSDEGGEDSDDAPPAFCSGEGEYTMSIEFVPGIFCVKGPACAGDTADGVCPGPQDGLPLGSFCGQVSTGVRGCKPFTEDTTPPPTESSGSSDDDDDDEGSADFCSGDDESEMSVEGAEGIYCVKGQACVADIADGTCPGPQTGLEFGASCGIVQSGVYGCKANPGPIAKHHKKAHIAKKLRHTAAKKMHQTKKVEHAARKKTVVQHKKTVAHAKKTVVHAKKTAATHQQKKSEVHAKKSHHGKKN